jgi:6-phosphogluconolactonase
MAEQSREVYVEPSVEQATGLASKFVKAIVTEAVGRHGFCYLALAGGTTPHGLYLRLASDGLSGDMPWQNVEVFFGDERDVPQDHVASNYRMAQRTLLDHVPIELMHVHPMPADADNIQSSAAEYEQAIRKAVPADEQGIPRFDLILLGMGADGHTVSLFPNTEAVEETQKLIIAYHVPVLGRSRMSITFPLINAARNVILFVTGLDKADAVAKFLGNDPTARAELPVSRVNPTRGNFKIILDAAAARAANLKFV